MYIKIIIEHQCTTFFDISVLNTISQNFDETPKPNCSPPK